MPGTITNENRKQHLDLATTATWWRLTLCLRFAARERPVRSYYKTQSRSQLALVAGNLSALLGPRTALTSVCAAHCAGCIPARRGGHVRLPPNFPLHSASPRAVAGPPRPIHRRVTRARLSAPWLKVADSRACHIERIQSLGPLSPHRTEGRDWIVRSLPSGCFCAQRRRGGADPQKANMQSSPQRHVTHVIHDPCFCRLVTHGLGLGAVLRPPPRDWAPLRRSCSPRPRRAGMGPGPGQPSRVLRGSAGSGAP